MAFIDIEVRKLDTLIRMAKKNDTPTYKVTQPIRLPGRNSGLFVITTTL